MIACVLYSNVDHCHWYGVTLIPLGQKKSCVYGHIRTDPIFLAPPLQFLKPKSNVQVYELIPCSLTKGVQKKLDKFSGLPTLILWSVNRKPNYFFWPYFTYISIFCTLFISPLFYPSVRQFADICLFSTAQYKCTVADLESE